MAKLDLRKELRQLYQPSSKAVEALHGKHHEIYLTVIRQSMVRQPMASQPRQ